MPFVKGQVANPNGRPKKDSWLTELAQAYGPEALDILVQQMRSDNPMIAQKAALGLLERGFGKPRQAIEHTGADGGPIDIVGLPPEEAYKRLLNG